MSSSRKVAASKMFSSISAVILAALIASPDAVSCQVRAINATIDTSKTGTPISKNIYGQFLEHGGDIVNTGVWSEMLVDRKFFYPVATSAPNASPVMGNAGGQSPLAPHAHSLVGADRRRRAVTMDAKNPYTGDHSPLVKLDCERSARLQPIRNRRSQR